MYYFIKTPFWAKLVFPGLVWKMPAGYNRIYLTFSKGATALNSIIFVEYKSYFIEKLHSKFH